MSIKGKFEKLMAEHSNTLLEELLQEISFLYSELKCLRFDSEGNLEKTDTDWLFNNSETIEQLKEKIDKLHFIAQSTIKQ